MAETDKLKGNVIPLLMATIFSAVGWGGVAYNVWRTNQALSYVAGSGTVISSCVSTCRHTHKGRTTTSYSPSVLYRYEVGGRTFTGDRYRLASSSSDSAGAAMRAVEDNPKGKTVTVWYDPQDPASSYLVKPEMFDRLPESGFFLLFALVGSAVFFLVLKGKVTSVRSLFGCEEDPDQFEREEDRVDTSGWEMMPPDGITVERSFETQALILTYRMRNWFVGLVGCLAGVAIPLVMGGALFDTLFHGAKLDRPEDVVLIVVPALFLLISASAICSALYQCFGRQELTVSREGSRFFYGIGRLGFTRRMVLDFRTRVSVETTYRGKQRTPYYIVRLESDGRSVKTFATPKAELARGLQDFIRVQLARI